MSTIAAPAGGVLVPGMAACVGVAVMHVDLGGWFREWLAEPSGSPRGVKDVGPQNNVEVILTKLLLCRVFTNV